MKKKTLGFKLVAGGLIAVLIPLLAVGIFSVVKASSALENAAKERAVGGALKLADMVQSTLVTELKIASEIAGSDEALNAANGVNAQAMDNRLAGAQATIGKDYESIVIMDAKGVVVADGIQGKSKGMSLAEREYFQKAKTGHASVGSVVKSKLSGSPIATLCAPIRRDGKFMGAVMIALKIDYLSDKVTSKMGKTGYGFMADSTGIAIAHPDKANVLTLNFTTVNGMEEIVKKLLAHQTGVQDYVFKGTSKIARICPRNAHGLERCPHAGHLRVSGGGPFDPQLHPHHRPRISRDHGCGRRGLCPEHLGAYQTGRGRDGRGSKPSRICIRRGGRSQPVPGRRSVRAGIVPGRKRRPPWKNWPP